MGVYNYLENVYAGRTNTYFALRCMAWMLVAVIPLVILFADIEPAVPQIVRWLAWPFAAVSIIGCLVDFGLALIQEKGGRSREREAEWDEERALQDELRALRKENERLKREQGG